MTVCEHFSQRSTWPPSAAVRQATAGSHAGPRFFLAVPVLSELFRGLFLHKLRAAYQAVERESAARYDHVHVRVGPVVAEDIRDITRPEMDIRVENSRGREAMHFRCSPKS